MIIPLFIVFYRLPVGTKCYRIVSIHSITWLTVGLMENITNVNGMFVITWSKLMSSNSSNLVPTKFQAHFPILFSGDCPPFASSHPPRPPRWHPPISAASPPKAAACTWLGKYGGRSWDLIMGYIYIYNIR